jgi:adenine-specific DNA-methyltransferase
MNKTDLIQKLKSLEGLTAAEKADLINLVNTNKKYGLVWEDKPEEVEEQLRQHLPVLQEVVEKRIIASPTPPKEGLKAAEKVKPSLFAAEEALENHSPSQNQTNNSAPPNHILIEGDNLHALTALSFTHEGKIDVIYIDPPYNTGNKDFKYNDSFVDKEDSYRHSKWLSFMDKRLRIAKKLLSEKGVIFISIDDYEQATLKLLCDSVFNESNFVGNVIWQRAFSPVNLKKTISQNHDFILIYCMQDFATLELNKLPRTDEANNRYKNPDNDSRGVWTSSDLTVGPVIEEKLYKIITPSGKEYYPPKGRCWVVSEKRFFELLADNRIWFGERKDNMPRQKKFITEVRDGVVAMSLWTHEEVGHTQEAKKELKEVLHENNNPFETVKPIKLIDRIFRLTTNNSKKFILLDFFAGSGTTLHATMQLNAEDGGSRQCILVTNNENNICEEVTYERNKRVIQGYTNGKGLRVEGLGNNNLRYYQSLFVPANKSEANKRLLTNTSTDLLCIKEDCYDDITEAQGFNSKQCRIYTNTAGKYLLVIYHSRQLAETCEALIAWIQAQPPVPGPIKLYAFSPEKDTLAEDFAEVADRIEAVPLPEAIYNAYRATFKTLKIDRQLITPEQVAANKEPELFDNPEQA